MSKGRKFLIALLAVVIAIPLVGFYLLTGPHGKLVAHSERKDASGYSLFVTVRQTSGRFRIDLSDQGARSPLLISSFELYQGSYPITNAIISWPDLYNFSVAFDNGIHVNCSWSPTNVTWTGRTL